jgi:hypothetical protein
VFVLSLKSISEYYPNIVEKDNENIIEPLKYGGMGWRWGGLA